MQTPKPVKGILAVHDYNDNQHLINTHQIISISEIVNEQWCKLIMANNSVFFYKNTLVVLLQQLRYSNP